MRNNPISLVSEKAFENLPELTSLQLDMHCGSCSNIPFWRWLKLNQKFSTSITCYDYGGEKLSNQQPNNVTDCFKCIVGYYGYKCNMSCDGCLLNSCDSEYGICADVSGCKPGWQPRQPKCNLACVDRTYGKNCSQDCSNNCYNNTCHVVSGVCLSGCKKGWMEPYCEQLFPKSADNYIAVGVGAFVLITSVAVIVPILRLKKRQQRRQTVAKFDRVTYSNIEVRSTEAHYADTIPVDQDQPCDQLVHSNPVEQEQPNAQYHTEVVDSSVEELELSNAQYNTEVVDSSVEELEHPYDTIEN